VVERRASDFERRVLQVLRRLRPGDVVTYGEVAVEAGYPGAARAVGNVLATSEGLPWWRVVSASGRLVRGHEREQARRLRAEGVQLEGTPVRVRARPAGRLLP
jgi:methylated-DNA-protein-cysteine methyltransferase related protein